MRNLIIIFILLLPLWVLAQTSSSKVLDDYIAKGLEGNYTIKQKQAQVQKGIAALDEAKRLWYPQINSNLTYTRAVGGREIAFPIGDLLNPVYATLNQLTQSNSFPSLENQTIQFLPDNFYDLNVKVSQPIYNPDIKINQKIKNAQVDISNGDIAIYQKELTKEIRNAYFHYCQADAVIAIYDNALALLEESLRVNESLLRNGVALPSIIARNNAEISNVQAQKINALNQRKNAAAYFNFLTNRNALDSIVIDKYLSEIPDVSISNTIVYNRLEIQQLQKLQTLQGVLLDLQKAQKLPKVGAQLTLGSQAFDFGWGGYGILGISIDAPIWTFKRNDLKEQQLQYDIQSTSAQMEQVSQQLTLQQNVAINNFQNSMEQYKRFDTQIYANEKYYKDMLRRYKEGQSNFIELLDARTQVTNINIQKAIARYDIWVNWADLERTK